MVQGIRIKTLNAFTAAVTLAVSLNPISGQPHAYVATFDESVSVIDTATNTVVTTIPGVTGLSVAAHPEGSKVYVTATEGVVVVSTATNTITGSIPLSGEPARLVVSPNGGTLYALSFSGTVWVVDTRMDEEVDSFSVTGSTHRGIEVHPSNQAVYVSNQNEGTVSVISASSNTEVDTIDVGNWPFNMVVHPSGEILYVTNYFDGTVSAIDTESNKELATLDAGSFPFALAVHPDGRRLYVTDEFTSEVIVLDTVSHSVIETIDVGSLPQGIDVRPDGKRVYVANAFDDSVSVIDTATNTVVATIDTAEAPFSVGRFISPPANIFADSFESGGTSFWSSVVVSVQ